jgi:hypothetical protein
VQVRRNRRGARVMTEKEIEGMKGMITRVREANILFNISEILQEKYASNKEKLQCIKDILS